MTDAPYEAAKLVYLNGGEMVGRTRLQKSAYLLREAGAGFAFDFDYYHYGPYSEELAVAASDAEALDLIGSKKGVTAAGDQYAIFTIGREYKDIGSPTDELATRVLGVLRSYDSLVLELAATADFLEKNGYGNEAWEETSKRKPSKATAARIASAKKLLGELEAIAV